jgi:hypothetical protein
MSAPNPGAEAVGPSVRAGRLARLGAWATATPWRRRALVVGGLAAAVAAVVSGAFLDVLRVVGRTLAGVGPMQWADRAGAWHEVPVVLADRRNWGVRDTFLLADSAPPWVARAAGLVSKDLAVRRAPNPQVVGLLAVRVDMSAWRPRVWGRADWSRDSVEDLARQAGLAVAFNAAYFTDDGPLGVVISDGVRRSPQARHRAAHFLVGADGRARIVNRKRAPLGDAVQAFQGFPALLSGGRVYAYLRTGGRGFDAWTVDRRTAACIDRGGRLVFLVTDTHTNGLTLDELATVMGGLGCVDAMAFDGGSSTGFHIALPGWSRGLSNLEPVPVIVGLAPVVR